MFCVYVLRSKRAGQRYVGCCEDLDDRLRRHNGGEIEGDEAWDSVSREQYYKTGRGRDELDLLQAAATGRSSNPVTPTTLK